MSESQKDWAEATAETISLEELDALMLERKEAWERYDVQKKITSELYGAAESLDTRILCLLNKAQKSKYFVDGIGTVNVIRQEIVRVPGSIEAKQKFFNYLQSIGEEVFYSLATVNSNSLNSWYREKVEEKRKEGALLGFLVPGIEEPTTRETLRFTKDKKGTNE